MLKNYEQYRVYPEDIQCVINPVNNKGGVFIGNLEAAQSLTTLKKYNIGAILTACKGVCIQHPKNHIPYHLYVPGQDHEMFDLSVYFDRSIQFIHQALNYTNILIHCMAGISRSVTLLIAYLIKYQNMTYQQAFHMLKRRRSIIKPNRGFVKQLKMYENQLKQLTYRRQHEKYVLDNNEYNSKRNSQYKYKNIYHSNQKINSQGMINMDINQYQNQYSTVNPQKSERYVHKDNYIKRSSKSHSYEQLNKQLDDKIAQIKKKYEKLYTNPKPLVFQAKQNQLKVNNYHSRSKNSSAYDTYYNRKPRIPFAHSINKKKNYIDF